MIIEGGLHLKLYLLFACNTCVAGQAELVDWTATGSRLGSCAVSPGGRWVLPIMWFFIVASTYTYTYLYARIYVCMLLHYFTAAVAICSHSVECLSHVNGISLKVNAYSFVYSSHMPVYICMCAPLHLECNFGGLAASPCRAAPFDGSDFFIVLKIFALILLLARCSWWSPLNTCTYFIYICIYTIHIYRYACVQLFVL